ncbi:peptidoglycan/xylan/chitin deacetylase (PgdA/CDA1 family) [Chryseobacterium defluvii]|uniref:Peptidoglycan/xylan/chitin deacetylase (PgdA/CDA1 family) n=1 Tax=Chryseobacterium defluvii TaxID=160396 RepID=A0A840KJ56_9FLAO|nr:polysaccharide deacetylase family protein [Chryseobacterium defluvii]MBB4807714.1 peptidoglycan/xylan/chitin deacetylase (PgdA/CDA1 family) [Chryseobacterium defluvii]
MIKERIISLLAGFENGNTERTFPLDYCLPIYHCVSDDNLPHLNRIIRYKNVRQFEEDLDYLSKCFQFVSWDEFKDYVKGKFRPQKKIVLLTFDDGFREFYDVVAPVLERKGIYAVNFVNPGFIDNQDLMFRCKASLIINELDKKTDVNPEFYNILQSQNESQEKIRKKILGISYLKKEILERLAESLELDFTLFLKEQKPYLSLKQLRILTQKGFGISAHSWDHPLYHELPTEQQLETTNRSIRYLKENGFHGDSFAFPFTDFGVSKAFFDELFRNREILCTFGGAGIKLDSVERNFQRIPMETGESAETLLKKEIAYFRFKKLFNKNRIVRK